MTLEHFGSIGRLKILSDLLGIHVTASSLPLESGCCHRNLRRFQPSQFIQPLWLEVEVLLEIYDISNQFIIYIYQMINGQKQIKSPN